MCIVHVHFNVCELIHSKTCPSYMYMCAPACICVCSCIHRAQRKELREWTAREWGHQTAPQIPIEPVQIHPQLCQEWRKLSMGCLVHTAGHRLSGQLPSLPTLRPIHQRCHKLDISLTQSFRQETISSECLRPESLVIMSPSDSRG